MACLGNSKILKSIKLRLKNTWVCEELQKAGFQAFFVGGCVRDMILGRTPKDFDVATSASNDDIKKLFKIEKTHGKITEQFGVVAWKDEDGTFFEVATFRDDSAMKDRYDGSPRPGTLETDAVRRDFTMNAIFLNPTDGSLLDPTGGIQDLRNGIIKTTQDPAWVFAQDPVRIVRAIRFNRKLNMSLGFDINEFLHLVDWNSPRVQQEVLAIERGL